MKFKSDPQIAVCFFGIDRSLAWTMPSITRNVLEPARAFGSVRIYAHLFKQASIDNPRSGEKGNTDPESFRLLEADWLELEAPDQCLETIDFNLLKRNGDPWDDDYKSMSNLVHQLHSLKSVTEAALADKPDLVIFCRPDLRYLDCLRRPIRRALRHRREHARLPNWQFNGGYNDRFAICTGERAIRAYGTRKDRLEAFATGNAVHSERFLRHALRHEDVDVGTMPHRAERVRLGGSVRHENFLRDNVRYMSQKYGFDLTSLIWFRYVMFDR